MRLFCGTHTALVTPFFNGKVDFQSLEKLITHQLQNNIDGFVVNGTTGESPTLIEGERIEIFKFVKEKTISGTPLIMGTGTNSTATTIEQTRAAQKLGASAALVVVPYYNKPPQRGLYEHFIQVANAVELPIILYNVPSRTVAGLEVETIRSLSAHPNIIGIKEASGNISFAKSIREACGKDFVLLSGDDGSYEDFKSVGGDGVISVASHIIPKAMAEAKLNKYLPLIKLLFSEANPIPVKMALYLMGIIKSPELRLPLVILEEGDAKKLSTELRNVGLLK